MLYSNSRSTPASIISGVILISGTSAFAMPSDITKPRLVRQPDSSRNFDETTVNALADRGIVIPGEGLILDVGCGRGRCIEFLGVDAQRVVQLDSSRNMLKLQDRETCCLRVHADATAVPLLDDQFIAVVEVLIDPFIGLNFFSEAFRLLKRGGVFFASTHTSNWGSCWRKRGDYPRRGPLSRSRSKRIPRTASPA